MPRTPDDFRVGESVDESFFQRQARDVARDLIGTLLVNDTDEGRVGGLVVETEAYVNAVDPACHLTAGRTARTEPFFSGAGTVYVFVMHGHAALNFITAAGDHPEGVLVRALEPTHGVDVMRERRGYDDPALLASGPGRLTEALDVTKADYDDRPLAETSLSVHRTDWHPDVDVTGRVGVTSAADWPLRYVAADSDYVSSPPPDVDLDHDAVEDAYDRLAEDDLPTVDDA
ncbi:MAG: DNA-3-methyladenine glycosylase [Halobacterium sp.]